METSRTDACCVLYACYANPDPDEEHVNNRASEPSLARYALWNRKQRKTTSTARRVLVANTDRALGESLVSLFALKGFTTEYAMDCASVRTIVRTWQPQVVFLDTRIGACGNYALARELRSIDGGESCLVIAMSGFLPEEPIHLLKEAGYDGHCRRPCAVWQMTDLLDEYFALRAMR
jgi:CheY-like chemotaxis protein